MQLRFLASHQSLIWLALVGGAVACSSSEGSGSSSGSNGTTTASCDAGTFVSGAGACTPCANGTFSAGKNANACTAWTTCPSDAPMLAEGTASRDRICDKDWVFRASTDPVGVVEAMSVSAAGETFLLGYSGNATSIHKIDAGGFQVSSTPFDPGGSIVRARVNKSGRFAVLSRPSDGSTKVSVRSFSPDGVAAWSHDLPVLGASTALGEDDEGNVAIAVNSLDKIPPEEQPPSDKPVYVAKWNAAGALTMSVRLPHLQGMPSYSFGSVSSVAFDKDGNVLVTGFYKQDQNDQTGGYIRKLNGTTGADMWTTPALINFTIQENAFLDQIKVVASPTGEVFVGCGVNGFSSGYREVDIYLSAYNNDGANLGGERFGQHNGNEGGETLADMSVDAEGKLEVLAFSYHGSGGNLPGGTMAYVRTFAKKVDPAAPESVRYRTELTRIFQPQLEPISIPDAVPQFGGVDARGNTYILLQKDGGQYFQGLVKTKTVGHEIQLNHDDPI